MRKKPRQSAASAAIRRFSDGVSNPLLRIGTGTPNTFGATTYLPQFTTMARQTLEWAYQTSWMCGLVVDIPAEDMTREGIEIKCEDPKASEAIQRAFDRFGVMDQLCDAIKWARLYGGATTVQGIKADIVPVLVGKQGARKSTLVRVLAPREDLAGEISLETRDADLARQIRGKVVVEIPELHRLQLSIA